MEVLRLEVADYLIETFSPWRNFLESKNYLFTDNEDHFNQMVVTENQITLKRNNKKLSIDFSGSDYHRASRSGKQELILRALGIRKELRVLDLTAGLGQDAVFFAQKSCHVTSLERHPLIFVMLKWAQRKLQIREPGSLDFVFADSARFLQSNDLSTWDSIYYDPMYPQKQKSALPRQEMVVFRGLVGDDLDSGEILQSLLKTKQYHNSRIILKRPLKAPADPKPLHSFRGSSVRYDLY